MIGHFLDVVNTPPSSSVPFFLPPCRIWARHAAGQIDVDSLVNLWRLVEVPRLSYLSYCISLVEKLMR